MPDPQPTVATARQLAHTRSHVLLERGDGVVFDFERRHFGGAFGASVASHIAMLVIALLILRFAPHRQVTEIVPDRLPSEIVWLAEEGPGGGGGGGGDNTPEPPKAVELPGIEKVSVPVEVEPEPITETPEEEPPLETLLPAVQTAAAPIEAPGAITAEPAATTSAGSGEGGGGGTGTGGGSGAGDGKGLGQGNTGGVGGGEYEIGNGVTRPQLLKEVKPAYTAEAMRAKVQGVVWLRCIVLPDGSVGRVEVVRSLDSVFGLDQEAIKAAQQWRFTPGMRLGEPVSVRITIELTFTLR